MMFNTMWLQLKQMPPTSSTVYGLGVLLALVCYWATGSVEFAVLMLGAFKVICPQDTPAIDAAIAQARTLATAPAAGPSGGVGGGGTMRALALLAVLTAAIGGLGACTGPQLAALTAGATTAEGRVSSVALAIQPELIPVCNAAMGLAGLAGPIAPYILAGCGTAEAIDKLAADPSSTAWVNGLIAMVPKRA